MKGYKMFRTNLSNLLSDAFGHMQASASDGKWHAYCTGYGVDVYHYTTHMFTFLNDGTIVPVDPGHGSASDRCGVRRITSSLGMDWEPAGKYSLGYRELYKMPLPALLRSPAGNVMGINYKTP